jgi:hypothetical protein
MTACTTLSGKDEKEGVLHTSDWRKAHLGSSIYCFEAYPLHILIYM